MPRLYTILHNPRVEKVFLCVLAAVYVVYLVGFAQTFFPQSSTPAPTAGIAEDVVNTNPVSVEQYWTTTRMSSATDEDVQISNDGDFSQVNADASAGKAARQDGQPPQNGSLDFPISTVGKIFFSDGSGRNYVCSGTAIASSNHNMVDTAGHCLYGQGKWMQNEMFCPLYNNGFGPYDCWVARALLVPNEWISARPNQLHRDFGMIVVDPNDAGDLTDVVGGAGWAYNQKIEQPFYAYGYPAAYPFNGQTRQSCDKGSIGKAWNHAGGKVVSIPCNMTGGSSGGGWFIKDGNSWYLDGHNDFTSTIQRGHMFSPYYDDVWFALYSKAQNE